jgi:hypothetical protein
MTKAKGHQTVSHEFESKEIKSLQPNQPLSSMSTNKRYIPQQKTSPTKKPRLPKQVLDGKDPEELLVMAYKVSLQVKHIESLIGATRVYDEVWLKD